MDDPLNIQPTQPRQVDQTDDDQKRKRVEPKKPDDRFAKMVDKKSSSKDEDEEEGSLISSLKEDDEQDASIFSLARKASAPKKDRSKEGISTGQNKADIGALQEEEEMEMGDADEDGKNKNSNTFDLSKESQKDLFQLLQTQTQIQTTTFAEKAQSLSRQQTADLVTQMIEKLTTMKTQGDITTELTLKYPPLFEGAQISIKQSATAPGQFNISFQNLTAQAKQMVDMQQSRESLKQSLAEKGYNVHIIIATTQIEKPEYKQELNPQNDQQQQGQQQGQEENPQQQ